MTFKSEAANALVDLLDALQIERKPFSPSERVVGIPNLERFWMAYDRAKNVLDSQGEWERIEDRARQLESDRNRFRP